MRARNIKPGFFKNEDLAELGPYHQLIFVGLWQLSDKGGKLEDRPKRIKAEIFPYYDPKPSVETLLNHLIEKGFLIRYKVGSMKLLKIANFEKHQSPHHTEKESTIPDPCEAPLITSDSPSNNGELTVNSPSMDGGNPPDSLIPDSLITDSLITDKDASPPPDGSGDALVPVPIFVFSCAHFDVEADYFQQLMKDYPGLDYDRLLAEIKKAADYCSDNPKKHKRNSRGKLVNKRLYLRNWMENATTKGQRGQPMSKAEQVTAANLRAAREAME